MTVLVATEGNKWEIKTIILICIIHIGLCCTLVQDFSLR